MPGSKMTLRGILLLAFIALAVLWIHLSGAVEGRVLGGAGEPSSPQGSLASTGTISHCVYLPFVSRARECTPIPGAEYGQLPVPGPHPDNPADHPDLNLAVRGYEPTEAYLGLVDYGGGFDPGAPQLYGLFADQRTPAFVAAYKVYDWDWPNNRRGNLIETWPVTLLGMGVSPGETVHVPPSGYEIGQGYEVLVLYAEPSRITLKYTLEDSVVSGYTIHLEDICVDPNLLDLYRSLDAAGRSHLPALRSGQAFATARGYELKAAIRDYGSFMDPRSRKDWWQGR